jgi:hypothetical protein
MFFLGQRDYNRSYLNKFLVVDIEILNQSKKKYVMRYHTFILYSYMH